MDVAASEMADHVDANVSRRADIDVIVGQQAVVLVGTEQALRRTDDGFGEAVLVLRVHDLGSLRVRSMCRLDVMTIAQM
jgi:hypothetical protein